jgi:hypothetical protein
VFLQGFAFQNPYLTESTVAEKKKKMSVTLFQYAHNLISYKQLLVGKEIEKML